LSEEEWFVERLLCKAAIIVLSHRIASLIREPSVRRPENRVSKGHLIDPAWAVSASQRFEIRDVHYKVRMRVFKFAQAGSIIEGRDTGSLCQYPDA
jgi:hypothetical protein